MSAIQFMLAALTEAQKGRGACAPNPAVGAVVVKDNQIISRGYHKGYGEDHAEVMALSAINNEQAEGATLYVTLEPCSHWGQTPPCTDVIIQRKLAKLVYGFVDPNPQMSGQSIKILTEQGIACEQLTLNEVNSFYRSYQQWMDTKKPSVTAKLALTLDGKIAAAGGRPVAITGVEAKQFTHQQRLQHDAILTTAATVLADDPQLNVRLEDKIISKPIFVIDRKLNLPLSAKLLQTAKHLTIFYASDLADETVKNYENQGIACVPIKATAGLLSLPEIMTYIGEQGVHDLWVEAGGKLAQQLWQDKIADELLFYVAPKILGAEALSAFSGVMDFSEAESVQWQSLGQDSLCRINRK